MARGKGCTVRLKANVFTVTFRHPVLNKVVHKSLKTDQKSLADTYKDDIDSLIAHPEHWDDPPVTLPSIVRQIWGQKHWSFALKGFPEAMDVKVPLHNPFPDLLPKFLEDPKNWESEEGKKANLVAQLLIQTASLAKEVERLRESQKSSAVALNAAKASLQQQAAQIADLTRERNYWKERRLSKLECGTLAEEQKKHEAFFKAKKINRFYKRDTLKVIERFVQELGSDRSVADVDEQEVTQWVALLRNFNDGSPLTEKRRRFVRIAVLAFLDFATKSTFNRRAVKAVESHRIRREQKEITWLERNDAEKLVQAMYELHGDYWGDMVRIQLDQGWRPSELIMLQTTFVGPKTVTLDSVDGEAAKTGKRALQIPATAQAAFERRVAAGGLFLFPRIAVHPPMRKREGEVRASMWDPIVFFRTFNDHLKAAATQAELHTPMDSRILRRTFGSLQLRAGKKEHEVAALMGDRVDTVRRHYARIVAEEVGIELAPLVIPTPAKTAGKPARTAPARGIARRMTRRPESRVDDQ